MDENRDAFRLTKKLFKICGISLNDNEPYYYKIYSAVILALNLYPLFQLIGASRFLENGKETFEFVIFETVTTLILIKSMVLVYNRPFFKGILHQLQTGVFVPNRERGGMTEYKLINDCIAFSERQSIVYWTVVTVTVMFALLDAAFSRITSDDYHDWKFEYSRVTIFNTTYSPNYEIASLYQNISWFTMGWTFAIYDLLMVTILAHLTCQLKILQNSIRNIIPNSYRNVLQERGQPVTGIDTKKTNAANIPWKHIKPLLNKAIEYHLEIFKIAQKIEDTFNILIMILLLSSMLLIASLLYRLNVLHIGGVMCLMCEISLICYWGNEISLESQNVIFACYDVNFVGSDLRFQKALIIIMQRSKRPIVLTAGKFSPLTLGTFLWIARSSYSYLMILRRVNT